MRQSKRWNVSTLTDLRASSLPIHGEVSEKSELCSCLCRSADGAEGLRSWGLRPQKHNPPNKMSPLSSGLRGYCHSAPMGYVLRSSLSEMSLEKSERRVALTTLEVWFRGVFWMACVTLVGAVVGFGAAAMPETVSTETILGGMFFVALILAYLVEMFYTWWISLKNATLEPMEQVTKS